MLLPRLILIPMLLLAQVCSAACGRSLFVWCLGPHGDLKLELPHDECRHDCDDEPASSPTDEHADHFEYGDPGEESLVDSHGCSDIAADLTVPAWRRPAAGLGITATPGTAALPPALGASLTIAACPRIARPRAMLDQPPPALNILRTVRLLV